MIDFHTHILPYMDDGAIDLKTSLTMLEKSKELGIDIVVASSHFYPNCEDISSFITRRDKSYELIKNEAPIKVLRGAEVQFFKGISLNPDVKNLCIEGTRILLVEMPFGLRFDHSMIDEIIELSNKYVVMLAHFERYLDSNPIKVFKKLSDCGIILQVNANSFSKMFLKNKLAKLVKEGYVKVIASDMHNLSTRPQNIDKSLKFLYKKLDKEFVDNLISNGYELLGGESHD